MARIDHHGSARVGFGIKAEDQGFQVLRRVQDMDKQLIVDQLWLESQVQFQTIPICHPAVNAQKEGAVACV